MAAWPVVGAPAQKKASERVPGERILHFPAEYAVGTILIVDEPLTYRRKPRGRSFATAQGDVRVPLGKSLKFHPSSAFFQHPDCLLKLPPDTFDYIKLQFMSMADNEDGLSDRAMPYIHHLSGLQSIDLDNSETTDAGLAKLGSMPALRALTMDSTMVKGPGLKQLKAPRLIMLRVGRSQVDNESLSSLQQFPLLENLGMVHVGLDLKGLSHIAKCHNLHNLELGENRIDDSAVPFLLQLKKLKSISVKQTGITIKGLERLARNGVEEVQLMRPLKNYSKSDQLAIRKAFPRERFNGVDRQKSSEEYNRFMYAPLSRDRPKLH